MSKDATGDAGADGCDDNITTLANVADGNDDNDNDNITTLADDDNDNKNLTTLAVLQLLAVRVCPRFFSIVTISCNNCHNLCFHRVHKLI